jgi:hypothetical protein
LVILQSRFSKYFSEAISEKYKWITGQFRTYSPQNYDFSLEGGGREEEEEKEENCIDIITNIVLLDIICRPVFI